MISLNRNKTTMTGSQYTISIINRLAQNDSKLPWTPTRPFAKTRTLLAVPLFGTIVSVHLFIPVSFSIKWLTVFWPDSKCVRTEIPLNQAYLYYESTKCKTLLLPRRRSKYDRDPAKLGWVDNKRKLDSVGIYFFRYPTPNPYASKSYIG